jgi:ribonucleoside-diphosphate reductase beta chain
MKQGVELGRAYADDILPNGILGVNSDMLNQYIEFLANDRLRSVGLEPQFDSDKNPFPFLSETQDADAMSAFFERREKNYRNASVLEDDF